MAGAAARDDTEQLLHLKLAFLAAEPPACVLALARYALPLAVQNRLVQPSIEFVVGNGDHRLRLVQPLVQSALQLLPEVLVLVL
jgi:hypothetical protein